MFKNTQGKGFQMTFANGNTISVQWGYGNYCENRDGEMTYNMKGRDIMTESIDAEVATWDKDGNWNLKTFITDNGDDVKGWLTADEVLELMNKVATA